MASEDGSDETGELVALYREHVAPLPNAIHANIQVFVQQLKWIDNVIQQSIPEANNMEEAVAFLGPEFIEFETHRACGAETTADLLSPERAPRNRASLAGRGGPRARAAERGSVQPDLPGHVPQFIFENHTPARISARGKILRSTNIGVGKWSHVGCEFDVHNSQPLRRRGNPENYLERLDHSKFS